jgi:hypothetical protein
VQAAAQYGKLHADREEFGRGFTFFTVIGNENTLRAVQMVKFSHFLAIIKLESTP